MASASIFLSLPAASYVHGPYPPMYGVWFSCLGRGRGESTLKALLNRVKSKAFHPIKSPPLTDYLDSLSHHRNVASLSILCCYFHADCSSELANCMPPPLPQPSCTRLSTGVGNRHLPSTGIFQERYLRECRQCCRLSDSPCLLFPVPLVSRLHKRAAAACPLKTTFTTYITILHLTLLHSLQL